MLQQRDSQTALPARRGLVSQPRVNAEARQRMLISIAILQHRRPARLFHGKDGDAREPDRAGRLDFVNMAVSVEERRVAAGAGGMAARQCGTATRQVGQA